MFTAITIQIRFKTRATAIEICWYSLGFGFIFDKRILNLEYSMFNTISPISPPVLLKSVWCVSLEFGFILLFFIWIYSLISKIFFKICFNKILQWKVYILLELFPARLNCRGLNYLRAELSGAELSWGWIAGAELTGLNCLGLNCWG